MPSRFGLKDFVFLLLLIAVGASVWLKMVQDDRQWRKLSGIESRLGEIEKRLGEIKGGSAATASGPTSNTIAPQPPARDETWARPGVPISWQPLPSLKNDPRKVPGYREGGELTELLESDPGCITPFVAQTGAGRRPSELVCEMLAEFDPETLEMRGALAEAWQMDPAGRWLRVKIRDAAVFSDGSPVTADDAAWTLNDYIRNPQIAAERYRSAYTLIEGCKAISPRCAEFTFSEPYYLGLETALTLYVLPRAFYQRYQPSQINQSTGLLMGSGPYRIEGMERGEQWKKDTPVVLVRNERYWSARPALDRIRFSAAADPVARLTIYLSGEADMVTPSAAQFTKAQAQPGFADKHRALNWMNVRSGMNFIAWQCGPRKGGKITPFADKRVRTAMTMLLDRDWILKEVYDGLGQVAAGPFNPLSVMSDRALKPLLFDMAAAKALLAEAGWRDRDADGVIENESGERFEFEFARPSTEESDRRLAAYLSDQCAKVGIVCHDRPLEAKALTAAAGARDFDALRLAFAPIAAEPDPRQRWHSAAIAAGGNNISQWSSPEADRLIDAGRTELDPAKRSAIWRQLEGVIAAEQPFTFLRHAPWLRLVRKDVGNVHAYPMGLNLAEFFRMAPAGQPR